MVEDESFFLLDSKAGVIEYIESYSNITFLGGG
jgi:hypothetical protein